MTKRERRKQQVWASSLRDEEAAEGPTANRSSECAKVITLWIPQRFLHPSGIDLRGFVLEVNERILRRGFVLSDGQVLTTPLSDIPEPGVLHPEEVMCDGHKLVRPLACGDHSEAIWERDGGDATFDVPPPRDWQSPQRAFFGLENPYQMAEDSADYTWSRVISRVIEPYISLEERIAAIVDGERDGSYFYCPCHSAEVTYTTRHRMVCMGCGATHLVLREPLLVSPTSLLTAQDWFDFFDEAGASRDEEIEIGIVDFQDVENADAIWTTSQWEEAKQEFVFFARSSPEEIAEATRGTEADSSIPSILLEAGWTPVETAPPPAHQVAHNSIDVDLVENAGISLREGVRYFIRARKSSEHLLTAIPQLFRAVELLLKAKLEQLDACALVDRPNNPAVLKRLAGNGIALSKDEVEVVARLRGMRNDLQHGAARFNHRRGLAASRAAIVLVDRFAYAELGLWAGDVLPSDDWYELLAIEQITRTAERVAEGRLTEIRGQPNVEISACERCGRDAMVRPQPRTGAFCVFCRHVPVWQEPEPL